MLSSWVPLPNSPSTKICAVVFKVGRPSGYDFNYLLKHKAVQVYKDGVQSECSSSHKGQDNSSSFMPKIQSGMSTYTLEVHAGHLYCLSPDNDTCVKHLEKLRPKHHGWLESSHECRAGLRRLIHNPSTQEAKAGKSHQFKEGTLP